MSIRRYVSSRSSQRTNLYMLASQVPGSVVLRQGDRLGLSSLLYVVEGNLCDSGNNSQLAPASASAVLM